MRILGACWARQLQQVSPQPAAPSEDKSSLSDTDFIVIVTVVVGTLLLLLLVLGSLYIWWECKTQNTGHGLPPYEEQHPSCPRVDSTSTTAAERAPSSTQHTLTPVYKAGESPASVASPGSVTQHMPAQTNGSYTPRNSAQQGGPVAGAAEPAALAPADKSASLDGVSISLTLPDDGSAAPQSKHLSVHTPPSTPLQLVSRSLPLHVHDHDGLAENVGSGWARRMSEERHKQLLQHTLTGAPRSGGGACKARSAADPASGQLQLLPARAGRRTRSDVDSTCSMPCPGPSSLGCASQSRSSPLVCRATASQDGLQYHQLGREGQAARPLNSSSSRSCGGHSREELRTPRSSLGTVVAEGMPLRQTLSAHGAATCPPPGHSISPTVSRASPLRPAAWAWSPQPKKASPHLAGGQRGMAVGVVENPLFSRMQHSLELGSTISAGRSISALSGGEGIAAEASEMCALGSPRASPTEDDVPAANHPGAAAGVGLHDALGLRTHMLLDDDAAGSDICRRTTGSSHGDLRSSGGPAAGVWLEEPLKPAHSTQHSAGVAPRASNSSGGSSSGVEFQLPMPPTGLQARAPLPAAQLYCIQSPR